MGLPQDNPYTRYLAQNQNNNTMYLKPTEPKPETPSPEEASTTLMPDMMEVPEKAVLPNEIETMNLNLAMEGMMETPSGSEPDDSWMMPLGSENQTTPMSMTKQRPWKRFFARLIDGLLFSIGVGVVCGVGFAVLLPMLMAAPPDEAAVSVLGVALYVGMMAVMALGMLMLETTFLWKWGATPGKMMLGIKVSNRHGNKLRFAEALKRSAWINLLAPLVSLIPFGGLALCALQYRFITGRGYATWDKGPQHQVTYK